MKHADTFMDYVVNVKIIDVDQFYRQLLGCNKNEDVREINWIYKGGYKTCIK